MMTNDGMEKIYKEAVVTYFKDNIPESVCDNCDEPQTPQSGWMDLVKAPKTKQNCYVFNSEGC
jgi:hypothetical protein